MCPKSDFSSGRWSRIANVHFAHGRETRDDRRIIAAIVDALEFGASDCRKHPVRFIVGVRLAFDETMVFGLGKRKKVGSFRPWNIAERTASVFDVEVAGDIQRMGFAFVCH